MYKVFVFSYKNNSLSTGNTAFITKFLTINLNSSLLFFIFRFIFVLNKPTYRNFI